MISKKILQNALNYYLLFPNQIFIPSLGPSVVNFTILKREWIFELRPNLAAPAVVNDQQKVKVLVKPVVNFHPFKECIVRPTLRSFHFGYIVNCVPPKIDGSVFKWK